MSRVTQLSRSVTTAASRASPLLDSTAHSAGASIMPKYADLLSRRTSEQHLDSRSITTTHRPTPQPSIANRSRPLMQTFSSSASSSSPRPSTLDATVIPSSSLFSSTAHASDIRVPLLPDNYSTTHTIHSSSEAPAPEVTIVASDPENVVPGSSLAEVNPAGGADVVDLGFAHQSAQHGQEKDEGNMLTDLWKGMMDDVFGAPAAKKV